MPVDTMTIVTRLLLQDEGMRGRLLSISAALKAVEKDAVGAKSALRGLFPAGMANHAGLFSEAMKRAREQVAHFATAAGNAQGPAKLTAQLRAANVEAKALEHTLAGMRFRGGGPGGVGGFGGGGRGSGGGHSLYGAYNAYASARMLAAPIISPIEKAAQLQREMLAIGLATRGDEGSMNRLRGVIEQSAGQTVFSTIDVAKMGKTIATGTGLDADAISRLLPIYTKFADVQQIMKGTPYSQSVVEGIRLAHTAGHYDEAGLTKYLDLLTKASLVVPGGLGEVGHALKYSQGVARSTLGVDDEQMVLLTAALNRMGFAGSRGGTNMIAAMTRSMPGIFGSGLLTGKSGEALRSMGFADAKGHSTIFSNGKFDTLKWLDHLSSYVGREFATHPEAIARQDILSNFQHAFGTQGSRVASLLTDPQVVQQLQLIRTDLEKGRSTSVMQGTFADESTWQKWRNLVTNWESLQAEVGYSTLPKVNWILSKLNDAAGGLTSFIRKNPAAADTYMIGGAAAGVGALGYFGYRFLTAGVALTGSARALTGSAAALDRAAASLAGRGAGGAGNAFTKGAAASGGASWLAMLGGAAVPVGAAVAAGYGLWGQIQHLRSNWDRGDYTVDPWSMTPSLTGRGLPPDPGYHRALRSEWGGPGLGGPLAHRMTGDPMLPGYSSDFFNAETAGMPGGSGMATIGSSVGDAIVEKLNGLIQSLAVALSGQVNLVGDVHLSIPGFGAAIGHLIANGLAHATGGAGAAPTTGGRPDFSGGPTLPGPL